MKIRVSTVLNSTTQQHYSDSNGLDFLLAFSDIDKNSSSTTPNITYLPDCYDPERMFIKKFVISLKPYMYPATIEFSVTCATLFIIMWHKIGKKHMKCVSLPPTKKISRVSAW